MDRGGPVPDPPREGRPSPGVHLPGDFPGTVQLGLCNLWAPAEVLAWLYAQPRLTAEQRRRTANVVIPQPVVAKTYKPPSRQAVAA